jgi:sortase A
MTSTASVRRAVAATLLALGLWHFGEGVWVYAKAQLAQQLIARAWREGEQRGVAPPPWPWADTRPVAQLRWPAGGVELYVLAGADGSALAFGPGMLAGSGGRVISAHRDTHFRFLADLAIDDWIELHDNSGIHRYRIAGLRVVDSRNEPLSVAPGELVLVTCYPFDAIRAGGPLRYRVSAVPLIL